MKWRGFRERSTFPRIWFRDLRIRFWSLEIEHLKVKHTTSCDKGVTGKYFFLIIMSISHWSYAIYILISWPGYKGNRKSLSQCDLFYSTLINTGTLFCIMYSILCLCSASTLKMVNLPILTPKMRTTGNLPVVNYCHTRKLNMDKKSNTNAPLKHDNILIKIMVCIMYRPSSFTAIKGNDFEMAHVGLILATSFSQW